MAHTPLGTLQGAAVSTALVVGVSLESILLAGDWVSSSTPVRQYISTYITTTCCQQDIVQQTLFSPSKQAVCWKV